jgi:hypothetical protein
MFWNVTPYILMQVCQRVGQALLLQLHDRSVSQMIDNQAQGISLCLLLPDCTVYIPDEKYVLAIGWQTDRFCIFIDL